ncbi:substrate-binding domain-containing protein [Microbacterium sp. NIBRBAC000506063]|uniref:substrate-binding domain-containing protein n=1 Tax=Microbacterium sp. NIBRBAC000506063 TaxID=2734618 RepID=UPI001BB6A1DB|nr:substrate-binding domain-containing protein [Microbacterium sp. NIBRBAC000506063]QTV80906.1 substrate-binding domain-containing protein [Microbacterium sp. NIBRBAC000506063]
MTCSLASEGCAQPAKAAQEAAEAIGWRVQIIDGKDTADTQNAAVQQALALGPDGIITFAINPTAIQGSLELARSQAVKVIASSATESDLVDFSNIPSLQTWVDSGSLLADYAIVKTEGDVKALVLHDTGFDVLEPQHQAFIDRLDECDTCEILEDQNFTFADLATSVPRLVQQMAQRHPDFNTFYIDYDYAVPSVLQGLRAIGAEGKIVLGSDGTSAAIQLIRDGGGQSATTAYALAWIGWADIDAMNRIFAGESPDPATEVLTRKLIDQQVALDQNIDGLWNGDVDFEAAYLKMWGWSSDPQTAPAFDASSTGPVDSRRRRCGDGDTPVRMRLLCRPGPGRNCVRLRSGRAAGT